MDNGQVCQRRRHRRRFCTPCDVWFFVDNGDRVRQSAARTRNLSEQGIGLLIKCPVLQGSPIEVRVAPPGRPPTYMAGVVMFCRYAYEGYHEVGIRLQDRQNHPIFSEEPTTAHSTIPWLRAALRDLVVASKLGTAPAEADK